jgi:hypothetical protein
MPPSANAKKTSEIARLLAADREVRMLTPEEIRQLRANTRRSGEQSRARYAKMQRPKLDDVTPGEEK